MNDIRDSIPSTNVKIIELYNKIEARALVLSPDFQRKLVWKKQHKYHFIETILKNYPFPEVYIASAEIDVSSITASEIVVDGQQRLSTIIDYIKGNGDFRDQLKIKSFENLSIEEKKSFLNYFVSVRDLKNIDMEIVKDIFTRINNTEYSLNAVEKINAQYGDSEFIIFCKQLVDQDYMPSADDTDVIADPIIRKKILAFLSKSNIFNEYDFKRMNDLQFMMTLVSTIIESDYFNRNQKVSNYIERFNSSFDRKSSAEAALERAIIFYDSLSFEKGSYWFTKSNAFTLLVEFSNLDIKDYEFTELRKRFLEFDIKSKKYFANIELSTINTTEQKYFEYAKEAVNSKGARQFRAEFVRAMLLEHKLSAKAGH